MKNKGTVIFISAVLAVVCLYQLSFTWVARNFEEKARKFATRNGVYDSKAYKNYIDSAGKADIYNILIAKYNYFDCKAREVSLGLDLRGGMNVILEIGKPDIVRGMAGTMAEDADLNAALKAADDKVRNSGGDFLDQFAEAWKTTGKGRKLAAIFATSDNKQINPNSTDNEVISYIRRESEGAIDRVYNVIEKRIAGASLTSPNIQKLEGGRISVELPGVDNPKRIEKLLQESAKLEFWETYSNTEANKYQAYRFLESANKALAAKMKRAKLGISDSAAKAADDSLKLAEAAKPDSLKKKDSTAAKTAANSQKPEDNPLFMVLAPYSDGKYIVPGAVAGIASKENMEKAMNLLNDPAVTAVLPSDIRFAWGAKSIDKEGEGSIFPLYFLRTNKKGKPAISGDFNVITDASYYNGPSGLEISMNMNETGATEWKRVTGQNVGKSVAIVLDNKVYSAPEVKQEIPTGRSQISGQFDLREAEDLVNVLKAGKLPAPASIVASEVVGPSLGKESIAKGLNSLLVGFIGVILFMVLMYSRGGVYSVIAVFGNIFLILGALSSMSGVSLTLPGIAGLLLTIGMAVDANVLIFERIKEEIAEGKSMKTAVANGYKSAFSAILDSNLTTLLAGVILIFSGSGPVYGFAIVLSVGILTSMYTALLFTRLLVDRRLSKGKDLSISFPWSNNILQGKSFNFTGQRKLFYTISIAVTLAGIGAFFMRGIPVGLDFKGGYAYQIQFDKTKTLNVADVKKKLDEALPKASNEVKTIGSSNQFKIMTTHMQDQPGKGVKDQVEKAVMDAVRPLGLEGSDSVALKASTSVGPSVATETRNRSFVLIILAIVGMFIYIVFRFRKVEYALGATLALVHDVTFVLGMFALLHGIMPFPMEFDQHLIAALLTLVGYSMNDTVIVFDRIREYLSTHHNAKDDEHLINKAINTTLSRTIVTASTVFLVLLALFIFGGDALKGFSFAMLIGVIIGTYSSIFIATPVVIDLRKKKNKNKD